MHSALLDTLSLSPGIAYALIFLLMTFEGDIVVFTSFFLLHQGVLGWYGTLGAIVAGFFLGDVLWFLLGRKPDEHSPLINRIHAFAERATSRFDEHLETRTFRTIFFSKFAYGLHHVLLLRAGMRNIPFKKFLWCDVRASLVWIAIVGGLGYLGGASFALVRQRLQIVELAILAFIVFLVCEKAIAYTMKKLL